MVEIVFNNFLNSNLNHHKNVQIFVYLRVSLANSREKKSVGRIYFCTEAACFFITSFQITGTKSCLFKTFKTNSIGTNQFRITFRSNCFIFVA